MLSSQQIPALKTKKNSVLKVRKLSFFRNYICVLQLCQKKPECTGWVHLARELEGQTVAVYQLVRGIGDFALLTAHGGNATRRTRVA